MNMARSTFYKRPHAGHRAAREKADTDLRVRIEDILAEFPAYGYRRVTHELRRRGLVINHKRVARVMREHALTPHRVRAWLATTNSDHKQPIYPNLRSSITPEGPDELWVADLTYIRLTTGFVFLAVVLDAWSRRVIGYAISHLLDTRLCLAALDAALLAAHGIQRPSPQDPRLANPGGDPIFGSRGLAWFTTPIAGSSMRLEPTAHASPPTVFEDRCPGGEIPMTTRTSRVSSKL